MLFLVLPLNLSAASCISAHTKLRLAAGHLLGSLFIQHLEEVMSRSQQVRGVQQEASEERCADL